MLVSLAAVFWRSRNVTSKKTAARETSDMSACSKFFYITFGKLRAWWRHHLWIWQGTILVFKITLKTFITKCDGVITICDNLVYQLHRTCEALTLHWNDYEQKNPTVLQSVYHKTQWKVTRENPIIISWQLLKIATAFLRQSATRSLFQIATGTTKGDDYCKLRLQNTMV